jgi:hypothetical protein
MPGFLVGAVLGFGEVRGEDDYGLVVGGADGEDVPGVDGDYQGGEEVELVGAVHDPFGRCRSLRVGLCACTYIRPSDARIRCGGRRLYVVGEQQILRDGAARNDKS